MLLTRDLILKADDLKRERVAVPEWGGDVFVRTLSGGEKDALEAAGYEKVSGRWEVNWQDYRARLVAAVCCDENGKAIFGTGDIPFLSRKSAAALDRIVDVAKRLNGVTDADIEDMAKNLPGGPNAGPGSASPDSGASQPYVPPNPA